MKKITICLICLMSLISPIVASAQSASPSGSLRDSVKEKVAAELSQIKQGVAKKGYVGSVTAKNDATLTITTLKNQTRQVMVTTTDTTIKLANNKDGTIADIKLNDFVIAMGDVDSEGKMTVKRLLVLPSAPAEKRETYFGTITKSTSSSFTVKTAKSEMEMKVSAGTKYNDKFKLADLKADTKVVVIALTGGTSTKPTYSALRVHLIQ